MCSKFQNSYTFILVLTSGANLNEGQEKRVPFCVKFVCIQILYSFFSLKHGLIDRENYSIIIKILNKTIVLKITQYFFYIILSDLKLI